MNARTIPASTAFCISATAASASAFVACAGSLPSLSIVRPTASRISLRNVTLPFHLGSAVQSAFRLGLLAGDGVVVAQAGHARLPRRVVVVGRVEADALVDVLHVRDLLRRVLQVDLLDPARADEPGGHPVGQHDEVPAGVRAGLEGRPDRAEELVVRVDDLLVVDRRPVLRLEVIERLVLGRVVLVGVDVERPVREVELGRRRLRRARRGRGRGCRAGGRLGHAAAGRCRRLGAAAARAAGGQERAEPDQRRCPGGSADG